MVVRARAAIRAGSYRLQVPEHKFKSHPGVPPARLTDHTFFKSYVKNGYISVQFALFLASTNTRPKELQNPVVVDN